MKTKQLTGFLEKAPADSGYDGTFILSTQSVDRDGDILDIDGWDLENFKKNPIALWQHDHKNPVGVWENIRFEADRLVADLKLGSTRLAEMTRQLIQDGILKAVSVGFKALEGEPRNEDRPWSGYHFTKQELLEASLVSVPANQEALLLSKSLELSDEELSAIFCDRTNPQDKSVDEDLIKRARSLSGKSAENPKLISNNEDKTMTLSERIKAKQAEIARLREELSAATEKYAEEATDENRETVEAFAGKIEEIETQLKTLEKAETAITASIAAPISKGNQATGVVQTVKDYGPGELIFRQAAVKWLGWTTNRPDAEIIRERYPNDKGLQAITKADSVPGDTTTTAWAESLLETQVESFIDLLANNSVFGALRGPGLSLNFNGAGSIKIPARTTTKTPPGAFVGEGAPIPVKELSFTSQTLTRHKMGVIVTMTEELIDATNSQIEAIVRQAILDDTGKTLDGILLDATAGSAIRPAGLLNGVTTTTSAGATSANIITDLKALLAPFNTDDAGKNLRIIINPQRLLGLATVVNAVGQMQFAEEVSRGQLMGIPLIVSANVATDAVHCVNAGELVYAYDGPMFMESNTATLHMEDTTPLEIVSGAPVTADPVRSLFQTYVRGIRMILPVTWAMRRSSQVSGLDTVAW